MIIGDSGASSSFLLLLLLSTPSIAHSESIGGGDGLPQKGKDANAKVISPSQSLDSSACVASLLLLLLFATRIVGSFDPSIVAIISQLLLLLLLRHEVG